MKESLGKQKINKGRKVERKEGNSSYNEIEIQSNF